MRAYQTETSKKRVAGDGSMWEQIVKLNIYKIIIITIN
jgi:hypothetical protein